MAEKRNLGRHRKRIKLRFGTDEPSRLAFTEDISSTGLFIKTANTYNPGAVVIIEMDITEEKKALFEARVMWTKRVPPQMIHLVKKGGMGVRINRFISGESEYTGLCEELGSR